MENKNERKPGYYHVKKIANAASYQDLDPWDIAYWDDKQGYWLKHGSMGIWPEHYWDEIDETPITRQPLASPLSDELAAALKEIDGLQGHSNSHLIMRRTFEITAAALAKYQQAKQNS